MNNSKTKLTTNGMLYEIKQYEHPLQFVEEYIYIGQIKKRRITTGWKRYSSHQ